MAEVQGRPLSQRCHKHNGNTCWGQLHAQNWGQQGLLACTPRLRDALAALWKCFVDLPASEASHRSLYGNWKIGLGPARERVPLRGSQTSLVSHTHIDIRLHAHMAQFPVTQFFRFFFFFLSRVFFSYFILIFLKERHNEIEKKDNDILHFLIL